MFQKVFVNDLRILLRGKQNLFNLVTTNFEAVNGPGDSEKHPMIEVYLIASKGIFCVVMIKTPLAATIDFCVKNNLLIDEPVGSQ